MEKQLYESLLCSINVGISNGINEAYDNALLESFDFKAFLDSAIGKSKQALGAAKNAALNAKIDVAYKFIKKYIAKSIEEIKKTKGIEAALEYAKNVKESVEDLIRKNDLNPKKIMNAIKVVTIATLTLASASAIYASTQNEMSNELETEKIESLFVKNPLEIKQEKEYTEPIKYIETYGAKQMIPSDSCVKAIATFEAISLYPYYAPGEQYKGIITIGYGHVIFNGRTWILPKCLSPERQKQLKANILKYKKYIQISSCRNGENLNLSSKMPDLITKEEALLILKEDLGRADIYIRQTIGLMKCGPGYNMTDKVNKDVALYFYYNQNVYDALVSCTMNTGALENTTKFSKRLQNCRFDKTTNAVNAEDFAFTLQALKDGNGHNIKRRVKEYEIFGLGNTNLILQPFGSLMN